MLARNPANYEGVVSEINSSGGKAVGISTDIADAASVSNAFKKITSELFPNTPLAAAIFNPGGGFARKPFLELTEAEYTTSFDIQAKGAFLFSQAALPLLLKGVEEKSEHPPSLIFTGLLFFSSTLVVSSNGRKQEQRPVSRALPISRDSQAESLLFARFHSLWQENSAPRECMCRISLSMESLTFRASSITNSNMRMPS